MLNNRGQSLVLFILVLPILLLMLILVMDIGKVILLRNQLTNISEIVLDYGIDNIENDDIENELIELVKLNKSDINYVNVYIDDNKIYLMLNERSEGILSSFIKMSVFNVKTYYVGYIENNEKRVERMGD